MTSILRRTLSLGLSALLAGSLAHAAPPALKTTELGEGSTIVIVHALGGSRADWSATADKLAAHYRVVTVDLPGHGDSALPDSFTFAAAGAALAQVLAAQPAGGSVVVGHQFGGRVALAALATHPELARGLVLIDVPVALPVKLADEQKNAFLASMASSYDGVSRMMFSNLGRDTAQSRVIFESFARTKPATVQAFVREGFFNDGNRDALALRAPMLMLATSRLWKPGMTSGAVLTQLGWADTSAAVRRLPDTGYWAMKDQPDSLAAIIGEFAAARFGTKAK